ncbi:MAG: hypothetical protein N2323_00675 [candidate division WOR-3 bacterium]|nr:hypothetical protein [candidate division WOR-3 bacterium]MCX7836459.1 hypothetical protein [candidate division WOR-3 bacterium]MDW8114558.1 hypothetical protein [candidate division WOR-3 bacterium]
MKIKYFYCILISFLLLCVRKWCDKKEKPIWNIERLEKIEFLRILLNCYFDKVEFTKEYLLGCVVDRKIIFFKPPSYNIECETIISKERIKATKIVSDSFFIIDNMSGRCGVLDIKNKKVIKVLDFDKPIMNY